MTLKERFNNLVPKEFGGMYEPLLSDCENVADDYAIEFAEWCLVNNVYKSETFENDNLFLCGTKKYDDGTDRIYYMDELLKEFKKGL